MLLLEARDGDLIDGTGNARLEADAEPRGSLTRALGAFGERVLPGAQELARARKEGLAGTGQRDRAPVALEEGNPRSRSSTRICLESDG